MAIDWKANRNIVITGIFSTVCWIVFLYAVTRLQSEGIGTIFLIVAIISLLRFGQLLERSLEGVI